MTKNRMDATKKALKIKPPEVGKIYQIVHERKGAFEGECLTVFGDTVEMKITKGMAQALLPENEVHEGERVRFSLDLVQSLKLVEDIRIFDAVAKNLTTEQKLERMSKEERSLLLYFGARAVDNCGKVDVRHMNQGDMAIAKKWNLEGLIEFKPIDTKSKKNTVVGIDAHHHGISNTHYVVLTKEAWELECAERQARSKRKNPPQIPPRRNKGR